VQATISTSSGLHVKQKARTSILSSANVVSRVSPQILQQATTHELVSVVEAETARDTWRFLHTQMTIMVAFFFVLFARLALATSLAAPSASTLFHAALSFIAFLGAQTSGGTFCT